MFGYSDPIVKKLFQELPNADKCKGYTTKDLSSIPSVTRDDEEEEGDSEEEGEEKEKKKSRNEDGSVAKSSSTTTTSTTKARRAPRKQKGSAKGGEDNLQKLVPMLKVLGQGLDEKVGEIDVASATTESVQLLQQKLAMLKEQLKQELEEDDEEEDDEGDEYEDEEAEEDEERIEEEEGDSNSAE